MHRAKYNPVIQGQYEECIKRVRDRYGVTYVECRADLPDHLFCDVFHALPEGGVVFSCRFAREVLVPFWRSTFAAVQGTTVSRPKGP